MKYLFLLSLVSLTNQMFAAESSAPKAQFGKESVQVTKYGRLGTVSYDFLMDGIQKYRNLKESGLVQGISLSQEGRTVKVEKPIFFKDITSDFENLRAQAQGSKLLKKLEVFESSLKELLHPNEALQLYGDEYQRCLLQTLCTEKCNESFENCWTLAIPGERPRVFSTEVAACKAQISYVATLALANTKRPKEVSLADEFAQGMEQMVASKSPEFKRVIKEAVEQKMASFENHAVMFCYVGRVVTPNFMYHSHH